MKSTKAIILAAAVLLGAASCKKYEEGPMLSLRSKKERVANDWRIGKAMNGDEDVTSDFDEYHVVFTKDNKTTLTATYKFLGTTYRFTTSGTWSFESDKEKLKVDYENDDADNTYLIIRLTEKEMWLREEGSSLELHLVPR